MGTTLTASRLLLGFSCLLGLLSVGCVESESIECPTGIVCPAGSRCAADQSAQACIFDECGDGELDEGEVCDDGNITSEDGCRADCGSMEVCGDLQVDDYLGEVCDEGRQCEDGTSCEDDGACVGIGDGLCAARNDGDCSSDCRSENVCGNEVVNSGETCDDANDVDGDGCDNNCTTTACGNTIRTNEEACDDGKHCSDSTSCDADLQCVGIGDELCTVRSGDGCDADCSVTGCGNGVTAGAEGCDDGRHCSNGATCIEDIDCMGVGDTLCIPRSGDGCSADCASQEICGDGEFDFGETCDNGSHCDDVAIGAPAGTAGTTCAQGSTTCDGLGDGLCAPRSDDGCSADCSSSEGCGNALRDSDEQCDDGFDASEDGAPSQGNACTNACLFNICGDGIINFAAEECDSGIGSVVDCDADCSTVECGDGFVNPAAGEQCDNGKSCSNGLDCSADAECVEIGDELCSHRDSATCDSDCTVAFCSDGLVNSVAGEECDSGGESAVCDFDCTDSDCRDGILNVSAGEQCDDGDASNTDACLADCSIAFCGDGFTRTGVEDCDEAGESSTCNFNCTTSTCPDGIVNASDGEQCDDDNSSNIDGCVNGCQVAFCGDSFVRDGVEACDTGGESATCDFDCTVPLCSDGILNGSAGEFCDDGNTDNTDACVGSCVLATCGDSFVQDGVEDCDSGGVAVVDCDVDCTLPECGDGDLNMASGEECDDGDDIDNNECRNDCTAAVCGDGILVAGLEDCDDGNILACGTCSTDCTVGGALVAATGLVTPSAPDTMTDGDTLTVNDGFNAPQVFEFNISGTVTAGNIEVDLTAGTVTRSRDVRDALIATINEHNALDPQLFRITALRTGPSIALTHALGTGLGNQAIVYNNGVNLDFVVAGMSGGRGADCAVGVGCAAAIDCASGICLGGGTCGDL
ncbi:MAG: hypothetical protein GY811_22835 [Myxococcales bacterium]|nr:hypothetical protein [Myxococcales bacterium]